MRRIQGGTLRIKKLAAPVAALAVGALVLTGCTSSGDTTSPTPGPSDTSAPAEGPRGTITVAEVNQFSSFNPDTALGNVDINSKITNATREGFIYIDADLNVVPNTSFGTYEMLSEDPLKVKYTVNEGIQWSDGEPIDADDLILGWAVVSGHYDDFTLDPDTGGIATGNAYFDYAGDTSGMGLTDFPEIGDDGRSITLSFSEPFADWEIGYGISAPAHVVWKNAGFASADEFIEHLKALPAGDPANPATPDEKLRAVADFWNTGFESKVLPSDPSLYLANGPYIVSAIEEGRSITLVPNENYKGANPAKLERIVVRTIGDASAQIQALSNGEVDIIAPQASADTLDALEALDGVTVQQGAQLAYDHIDLDFTTGVFNDANVREAFLKTVPRQEILDRIIKPLNPDAEVLNSQIFVPANTEYAETVGMNNSNKYGEVDIEGAKALLNGATPTVRILYNSENPNRVDAYTLIAESATKAGFVIVNEGDPAWGSRLGNGSYDAAIFGWTSPGVGVSGTPQLFSSSGGGNFGSYSNADVDAWATTLVKTADKAGQVELQQKIDAQLFADAFGLPLFQSVGVAAFTDRVQGIDKYQANQTGVWWNVWEWSVSDG